MVPRRLLLSWRLPSSIPNLIRINAAVPRRCLSNAPTPTAAVAAAVPDPPSTTLDHHRLPALETNARSLVSPLLYAPEIYMTVHINSFPYLISRNDTLRLPFRLPNVPIGSVLRMTHVSRIGSRDYTLQGHPFIDQTLFSLKMRVVEHTKMPLVVTVKKKQRQRRARHLPNKQNYTVLKYDPSPCALGL